jgi:hypothetical protein
MSVQGFSVREFALEALKDARIPASRYRIERDELYCVHVKICGEVSDAEFTVLELVSGLVWVQVWYAGMKLVVYAPPEMLRTDPIYDDIVTALQYSKDWDDIVVDYAAIVDELEDDRIELLRS